MKFSTLYVAGNLDPDGIGVLSPVALVSLNDLSPEGNDASDSPDLHEAFSDSVGWISVVTINLLGSVDGVDATVVAFLRSFVFAQ